MQMQSLPNLRLAIGRASTLALGPLLKKKNSAPGPCFTLTSANQRVLPTAKQRKATGTAAESQKFVFSVSGQIGDPHPSELSPASPAAGQGRQWRGGGVAAQGGSGREAKPPDPRARRGLAATTCGSPSSPRILSSPSPRPHS
jgi:hypothetical protein